MNFSAQISTVRLQNTMEISTGTINFWAKLSNANPGGSPNTQIDIFGHRAGSDSYSFRIAHTNNSTNPNQVQLTSDGGEVWADIGFDWASMSGSYQMFTITKDGTTGYSASINAGTFYPVCTVNTEFLLKYLGTYSTTYQNGMSGSLDEFRVYNRVLSQAEINTLYTDITSSLVYTGSSSTSGISDSFINPITGRYTASLSDKPGQETEPGVLQQLTGSEELQFYWE